MPVQGNREEQLLPELARRLIVFVAARVQVIIFPIRHKLPVAQDLLSLRKRVISLISEEIVAALVGNVNGVFGVGHVEVGQGE
jgi:hypothetical protein